jgi:3-dehydroquinate synthase
MSRASDKGTTKSEPIVVRVDLAERGYDIVIGGGLLTEVGTRIAFIKPKARAAIISDEAVDELYGERCEHALLSAGIESTKVIVRPGESSKCLKTYERVIDAILDSHIERSDLILALGGGVVGDLAGFAAATALRGIDFIQIPTTLLAQVDSAVGGKTGLDTKQGKNLIGAFHQPVLVISDTDLLDTLPVREFRSGYAEIAKYGLINDAPFFAWLEKKLSGVVAGGEDRINAVATSCRSKAAIVGRDERESGDRALLNLGHTFGHAFEAATGYSERLLHGEAISIGMVLAFKLSAKLGLCPQNDVQRVIDHLSAAGLPTILAQVEGGLPETGKLLELMMQDKKVEHGSLVFILARGIGKAFVARDIDINAVRGVLDEARRNT